MVYSIADNRNSITPFPNILLWFPVVLITLVLYIGVRIGSSVLGGDGTVSFNIKLMYLERLEGM